MRNRLIMALGVVIILSQAVFSQPKPIHFKKLQEFLPGDIPGYVRSKSTGETASYMGFSSSNAAIRYDTEIPEEGQAMDDYPKLSTLNVQIMDMVSVPGIAWMTMFQQSDFERESEEGYEKSTIVQDYPAFERAQTGEYKTCELTVSVGKRFFVEIKLSNNGNMDLIKGLADDLDLKGLEKLARTEPE